MKLRLIVLAVAVSSGAFAQEPTPKALTIRRSPAPPTSAASGAEMYRTYCAACHGVAGHGNGPAANALKKSPADLTMLAKNNGGTFPAQRFRDVVGAADLPAHGSREMPLWGPVFSRQSPHGPEGVKLRVYNLMKYVQAMQAK